MKKYKYLLWDIDGTLLDFLAAEKAALQKLFLSYGFGECTDEMISVYSEINIRYWQALEKNEMTKPEILVGRFRDFFKKMNLDCTKASDFNDDYQLALGDTIAFCDNGYELLQELKPHYVLAAVTNGTKVSQEKKLAASGLDKIFDYIFISEDIGVEKPNAGFFTPVIQKMQITDLSSVLIIGDSLSSDIKGGNNIGIDTCWYNPRNKTPDINVDITYEIHNLSEISTLIEQ